MPGVKLPPRLAAMSPWSKCGGKARAVLRRRARRWRAGHHRHRDGRHGLGDLRGNMSKTNLHVLKCHDPDCDHFVPQCLPRLVKPNRNSRLVSKGPEIGPRNFVKLFLKFATTNPQRRTGGNHRLMRISPKNCSARASIFCDLTAV